MILITSNSRRRTLFFGFGAFVLIIGAMVVPDDWIRPIENLYSVQAPAKDAYSVEVADLSAALEAGDPVAVSREELLKHLPQIQARRLTRAGPMTAKDMGEAVETLRDFQGRIAVEKTEGSKDAMRRFRDSSLAEELPRVSAEAITRELEMLDRQVELASFKVFESDESCESCHIAYGPEIEEVFDPRLFWPATGAEDVFDGTRMPTLMSPVELVEWASRTEQDIPSCTSCHAAHSDESFGVDVELRQDNMGLWANVYRIDELLYVQVKVQNKNAGHRVPAGYPGHAYAVVVEARRGDDRGAPLLDYWSGPELPRHLVRDGVRSGQLFHREMRDSDGAMTSRHSRVAQFVSDNRLESGRFVELRFLFDLKETNTDVYVPWWVMARLVYVPDVETLEGAQDVEVRIRKSASDP